MGAQNSFPVSSSSRHSYNSYSPHLNAYSNPYSPQIVNGLNPYSPQIVNGLNPNDPTVGNYCGQLYRLNILQGEDPVLPVPVVERAKTV